MRAEVAQGLVWQFCRKASMMSGEQTFLWSPVTQRSSGCPWHQECAQDSCVRLCLIPCVSPNTYIDVDLTFQPNFTSDMSSSNSAMLRVLHIQACEIELCASGRTGARVFAHVCALLLVMLCVFIQIQTNQPGPSCLIWVSMSVWVFIYSGMGYFRVQILYESPTFETTPLVSQVKQKTTTAKQIPSLWHVNATFKILARMRNPENIERRGNRSKHLRSG